MTTPLQPGWYDDPHDPNAQRYWDGHDWTPHRQRKPATRSVPAPAVPPPPPQPSPYQPAAPNYGTPTPPGGYQPSGYVAPPPPPGYEQSAAGFAQYPDAAPYPVAPQYPGDPQYPGAAQYPGAPQYAGGPQYPVGGVPFFSAGDAFNWAWNKFTKNALALILSMLIYGIGMAVIGAVLWVIALSMDLALVTGGMASTTGSGYGDSSSTSDGAAAGAGIGILGTIIVTALLVFVFIVAAIYVEAAFVSGSLDIADGKRVDVGSFLRPPHHFVSVVLSALLVAVGTVVGSILCVIPGLIFGFFAAYTIPFAVDRGLSPFEALKASYNTIKQHFGSALLSYLVVLAVGLVGNVVPVFGLLISAPVSLLILTYTYRRLSGGQLAPITP
jgi:uncharacterized membrane protein